MVFSRGHPNILTKALNSAHGANIFENNDSENQQALIQDYFCDSSISEAINDTGKITENDEDSADDTEFACNGSCVYNRNKCILHFPGILCMVSSIFRVHFFHITNKLVAVKTYLLMFT